MGCVRSFLARAPRTDQLALMRLIMPKRLYGKKDFSQLAESKRRRGNEDPSVDISTSDEESVISGVLRGEYPSLYLLELRLATNAIIVLNKAGTEFFMREFNFKTKKLRDRQYVSLWRKSCKFVEGEGDKEEWIYGCSCDVGQSDLVKGSGPIINITHEEWSQLNPGCLHTKVLSMAMRTFDDLFSLSPTVNQDAQEEDSCEDDDETFIEIHKNVVSVKPPSASWGILSKNAQGMKCLTCKYVTHNCVHVKYVGDSLDMECCPDFVAEFYDSCIVPGIDASSSPHQNRNCLSYREIPFERPGILKRLFDRRGDVLSAEAEAEVCHICDEGPLVNHPAVKELTLFTQYERQQLNIYSAHVPASKLCQHVIPFDGLQDGILNMSSFLIGHDVLQDYLFNFLHGRMPLYTFYTCWRQRQLDGDNTDAGMLSYSKFRLAWYSFLSLLSRDLRSDFVCPICQDSPAIVIFDATGLAFRRSYVPKSSLDPQEGRSSSLGNSGRFKDRVMVNNKQTRDLIQRYCSPQKPLESLDILLGPLAEHIPSIKSVVDWCVQQDGADHRLAPKCLRPLLISLAKPSAVSALIPPKAEMQRLLEEMKSSDVKQKPASLQSLQLMCPVLFHLVKDLSWNDGSLPGAFNALLTALWERSIGPFELLMPNNANAASTASNSSNTVTNAAANATNTTANATDATSNASHTTTNANNAAANSTHNTTNNEPDTFLESLSFFPKLPTVRTRGTYPQDFKNEKQACRKPGKPQKTLLPGTVTMHCQHGICYGFEVMLQVELPNTVFTILRTRFPTAPDVVIYDFACGLHSYCLNREAKFFQHTKFLVDRYHQPNHKGCSLGYKMDLYPQYKGVNSQIAEQKNSKLSRIKPHLSYMNPANFLRHAELFLSFHNKVKITTLLTS